MGSAASPFLDTTPADLEIGRLGRTATVLSRRARQRRQIQGMIAISYLVDAFILLLYAQAGTIPVEVAPVYLASGLASVALYLVLSETGFTERFTDHYFIVP